MNSMLEELDLEHFTTRSLQRLLLVSSLEKCLKADLRDRKSG